MPRIKTRVLIIDDDPKVHELLQATLPSFEFITAQNGIEGIQKVTTDKPELVLLDIKMPGMSGLEVLEKLNKQPQRPEVVMISGHGDTDYVVQSIKLGAAEFITKPFQVKEVEIHLNKILEGVRLRSENRELKSEVAAQKGFTAFVGDSAPMQRVKAIIDQVADSELTVLIRGESGTGKEIVARSLHELSRRREKPFVKVNCAAIPRDLLEAELFGYEKGAFTGAHKQKQGRFEVADKGTMFLDEIGDMPLELQSKLLQVLEQQEFVRVGGVNNISVDVRIICATNRNLEAAIKEQQFRDDLFYRLNEITLFLPPLRDRSEDIPLLAAHFAEKYARQYEKDDSPLDKQTLERLMRFHWPGNVRQLENMIKQVVVRGDEQIVNELISAAAAGPRPTGIASLEDDPNEPPLDNTYSLKKRIARMTAREERRVIAEVLQKTNWNRRKAADLLEISYRSLLYKIKDYDLNATE